MSMFRRHGAKRVPNHLGNHVGQRLVHCFAAALLVAGCSESEAPVVTKPVLSVFELEASEASVAEEAKGSLDPATVRDFGDDPVVQRIEFEPREPESRERFEAIVGVSGDWSSLQYVWMRNGEKFGPNAAEVVLPRLSTGDVIAVRVTPYQGDRPGRGLVMDSPVRNQRPRLSALSIERVEASESSGAQDERWRGEVRADDPDGDAIEIEYRWIVNGETSEIEDEFFPASQLKKGDRIGLRARAFDGRAWSRAAHSGEIVIGNSLPVIVSAPPRPGANGFFSYAVRAKDTGDVDEFRYSLRRSPRGMKIDESSGLVTWMPASDQAGRHEVEVVVHDRDGGEATQSFSLALVQSSETGPGPAATR